MAFSLRTQLALALDVDGTLLAYHQALNGESLSVVSKLLTSDRITLVVITGNDYTHLQRQRIVEPVPMDLRKNLIVYADGCTRKLTFTPEGQEALDETYRSKVKFDRDDKEQVRSILHREVQEWHQRCPELSIPDVSIEASGEAFQVVVGPLREGNNTTIAQRGQLCERLEKVLDETCVNVQVIPSDLLWVKLHCGHLRANATLDQLRQTLEQLVGHFTGLAAPAIIDRGEQLAVKPVKPQLRPEFVRRVKPFISGVGRHTSEEYSALIGGRVTIDVQKAGVDKAFAIRDLQALGLRGEILYFGDAFGPDGNDRPVASVESVTCLNAGSAEGVPAGVINLGGGPSMTLAYLRGILWALSGWAS